MPQTPDTTQPFEIIVERSESATRLRLSGELDIATADAFKEALDSADIAAGDHLIVDLSDVGFMDSSGLRLLISANRDSADAGYEFVVVTGNSPAKRVLELTRMDEHIRVVPALD